MMSDSTALVTWVEWLRRSGQIEVAHPQLVRSDTTVEDPSLASLAEELTEILEASGWECGLVEPSVHERLYCQILGRGLPPIHPGARRMRWCTRATKVDPMKRWHKSHSGGVMLTGLRLGESAIRDAKLAKKGIGCSAGGECGIPPTTDSTYSPIVNWKMCNVIDWLNGLASTKVNDLMVDILPLTKRLVEIYDVSIGQDGLWEDVEREISTARFGCNGCPAIAAGRFAPRSTVKRNGPDSPLNEIYDVWYEARLAVNRVVNPESGSRGPIRMHVRRILFDRVMDIQRRSGVTLVTPEDEAFIRLCWANKVYPRGWSAIDEANEPIEDTPLFEKEAG